MLGKVTPGQVSGRISHVADIYAASGRTQTISVAFTNTSDVITHYRLKDSGRASGWTITKMCKRIREGNCEVLNVSLGDTVGFDYTVHAPSAGTATVPWVLEAAHTCGFFGCVLLEVDRQRQKLSVR